ncbi:MAG TPA: succinate dehydrogenase assembly factor 2 [Burkholderiales bacterium]|jgi:succinate dehydrogenase flavin-adding protein (antitoxin of CptAB toxin-antitoxin module)|nr:succinate dehydrogenase assembly factor 2 [Burkholderiales bacterium]
MAEIDRVRWHCRRGLLELDVVLTRFLDRHFERLSPQQRAAFNRLLDYPDNDLWDFVTGKQLPPDAESAHIISLIE